MILYTTDTTRTYNAMLQVFGTVALNRHILRRIDDKITDLGVRSMVYSEDSAYLYFLYSNLQNYPFIVKTDIASKNSIRREVFANQAFSI